MLLPGAACDRIVFATDVIALSAGAYLPAAQGGLGSLSIPATAGYNFTTTYCRKITYATGLDAGVASTPGNANYTSGVTDGISGGYSAGSGVAPYDQANRFDAPTEIWTASLSSLAIGSFGSQSSSYGTYS